MTVSELLASILRIYPGSNPEALATFKPVFQSRFEHREGARLATAAAEVFATFRATARAPFPIPADFEAHMPTLAKDDKGGPPIRAELEAREARWRKLFNEWHSSQGLKIKAARPHPVFAACLLEAKDLCEKAKDDRERVMLSAQQIKLCEDRALSQARVRMFGPLPKTNEAWDAQIEQVRQAWANPQQEAA